MVSNYNKGILVEYWIIIYLMGHGYYPVERRYSCKLGEIDIIAVKKNKIIFCEVKYRKNTSYFNEAIQPRQIQRIRHAAQYWIKQNRTTHKKAHKKYNNLNFSFDCFFVTKKLKVIWIKNAF